MKNLKKSVSAVAAICTLATGFAPIGATETESNKSFLSSNNKLNYEEVHNIINSDTENNQFLANTAENKGIVVTVFNKKMYATTTVNIRKEASKESEIIGQLDFRDKVKTTSEESKDGWITVLYKNKVAYVYGEYLSTERPVAKPYTDSELNDMAHLIYAECGSSWCTDDMLYYAGSVVLNRVKSPKYPDNIHDVIYQRGQYACTWNGGINKTPDDRAWEIAEELLMWGSVLPSAVVYQAEFTQGQGVYTKVQNTYYCY